MILKYIRNTVKDVLHRFKPTRSVEVIRHIDDDLGGDIHGMLVYPKNRPVKSPGVVICPGYTAAYTQTLSAAHILAARGWPVYTFEYRRDGTDVAKNFFQLYADGSIAEDMVDDVLQRAADRIKEQEGSFWQDTAHALDILEDASTDIGIEVTDIGVVGFSLGGYVAATIQDPRIVARAAVNPFYYRAKPETLQPGTAYVIGTRDKFTPHNWNGEEMYREAPEPKTKITFDAGHFSLTDAFGLLPNNTLTRSTKRETLQRIGDWLETRFTA